MSLNRSNIEQAQDLLEKTNVSPGEGAYDTDEGLEEFLVASIKSNAYATIRIKYEYGEVVVSCSGKRLKTMEFPNYSEEEYRDFCKNFLKMNLDERDNCSQSIIIEGIKTRVFSFMKPFVQLPAPTISTTKIPPSKLDNTTVSDELFDQIVHSNFIIVGPSGSGKTYLMNYLINRFIRKDEQIVLIEEFLELIPPNKLCTSITCPPPKSDERSKLRFIVEQSNLMRLDAIFVGELKGGEAWPFVVNMASGTRGACTMHGDDAMKALSRLRALCQIETQNVDATNDFIAKSLNYVIVMKDQKIVSIEKLTNTHTKGNFALDTVHS